MPHYRGVLRDPRKLQITEFSRTSGHPRNLPSIINGDRVQLLGSEDPG